MCWDLRDAKDSGARIMVDIQIQWFGQRICGSGDQVDYCLGAMEHWRVEFGEFGIVRGA